MQAAIKYASDNEAIVSAAVEEDSFCLWYASDRLRANKSLVLKTVKRNGDMLCAVSDESFHEDATIVLAALEESEDAIKYVGKQLWDDEAFVLEASKWISGHSLLQNASASLRDNEAVVSAALETVVSAVFERDDTGLGLASDRLRASESFVLKVVKRDAGALQHASASLRDNETIVGAAVETNGCVGLRYASDRLRANEAIVLKAVKQCGELLEYASASLRDNEAVVGAAVEENGQSLEYASDRLRANEAMVLKAVKQDGRALEYGSTSLRDNEAIVGAAVKQSDGQVSAVHYASKRLRKDKPFWRKLSAA